MVTVMSLWIPILLSAVIVFVASSIIHMVLPIHKGDIKKLAKEEEVMEALRRFNIPPGDYAFPCPASMADMKSPAYIERRNKGPVANMTIRPSGGFSMGKSLVQWFVYCLLVSLFASYIAGRALAPGAAYLNVFRFVGAAAFMGYSFGVLQNSIWYGRSWVTTFKVMGDGLVFGLLTAGTFGWLWPS